MSSTLYLHIGFEKTGSTAIQYFLEKNQKSLNDRYSLYFPDIISKKKHIKLAVLAAPHSTGSLQKRLKIHNDLELSEFINDFSKDLKENIIYAIGKSKDIILSSEHLSSQVGTNEELSQFAETLQSFGINIKIIAYIRRQDQFILSRYNTWIKNGGKNKLSVNKNSKVLQYVDTIRLWERHFGREALVLKSYDSEKWADGNIIYDFLKVLNINSIKGLDCTLERQNISLDSKSITILKALNEFIPLFKDGHINVLRGNLANDISGISKGDKIQLSNSDKLNILNRFKLENKILEKEYNIVFNYNDLIKEPTDSFNVDLEFNKGQDIEQQDIYGACAHLWMKQQRKINHLLRKIEDLESAAAKRPDRVLKRFIKKN